MNQIFYSPNKIFYRQIEAGGAAGCVRAVPALSPLPRRGRCGDLGAAVTSGWDIDVFLDISCDTSSDTLNK